MDPVNCLEKQHQIITDIPLYLSFGLTFFGLNFSELPGCRNIHICRGSAPFSTEHSSNQIYFRHYSIVQCKCSLDQLNRFNVWVSVKWGRSAAIHFLMFSSFKWHWIVVIDKSELASNFNSHRGILVSSRALQISSLLSRSVDFRGQPTPSLFSELPWFWMRAIISTIVVRGWPNLWWISAIVCPNWFAPSIWPFWKSVSSWRDIVVVDKGGGGRVNLILTQTYGSVLYI